MPTLTKEQRRLLEKKVAEARRAAEAGAKLAIEQLGVAEPRPRPAPKPEEIELHSRLRARGRQIGDVREPKTGKQSVGHLAEAVAYEHWHRLLFARFLAESGLLLDPKTGVAIALEEIRERARAQSQDWMALAAQYAQPMLLNVFRANDPALDLRMPPEVRQALDKVLDQLPSDIFLAEDSLGWVYQFWQSERKAAVNAPGGAPDGIGADEIAAVTQLFTDDYMVLFLLHNTLGAWWAAKRRAEGKPPELPGYNWEYLRLNEDGSPAAGTFEGISKGNSANEAGWPRAARDLRIIDPCMGSGHFLVFALPILARMRMEEEGLKLEDALGAALRDNLFGLEIDDRCSQIAAFNLALTAWRIAGRQFPLPPLNLACSGLHINAPLGDWLKLARGVAPIEGGLKELFELFSKAPLLGSIINSQLAGHKVGPLLAPQLHSALEAALGTEESDYEQREMAVAARGLLAASRLMAADYTLVATNVPYLGRGKQSDALKQFCEDHFTAGKADLATCFVIRCLALCQPGGSAALVTPQAWLFLKSYRELRKHLLGNVQWDFVARLGEHAFDSAAAAGAFVALVALTRAAPAAGHRFAGWDASAAPNPSAKAGVLRADSAVAPVQGEQVRNPDAIVTLATGTAPPPLARIARSLQGVSPGDLPRFGRSFWETCFGSGWEPWQDSPDSTTPYGGRTRSLRFDGELAEAASEGTAFIRGTEVRGGTGIAVGQMRSLPATIFSGDLFTTNCAVIVPHDPHNIAAIWAFCSSEGFAAAVRSVDQKLNVTNAAFERVPFDLGHWRAVAARSYPGGLPRPHADDPTQWLFDGHPINSIRPLLAAAARLLGFRWPRQTGSSFIDCPALGPDGLEKHAIGDGIACLAPLASQEPAADRLRRLLQDAYGAEWSHQLLKTLIGEDLTLEEWLRDRFFAEHFMLFHQRPFIWHVWDGPTGGFHALVNYHRLAGPSGEGRRTLERLIYTYLGEWIARQEAEVGAGESGAEARLIAARHLKTELEKIATGEAPYDIFVRWKPLHEQPIGWEPDVNDGVRLNIRPWLTAKTYQAAKTGAKNACILRAMPKIRYGVDRGKEPPRDPVQFPWFAKNPGKRDNDIHLTLAEKEAGRGAT